jgi:competence protein ComEC
MTFLLLTSIFQLPAALYAAKYMRVYYLDWAQTGVEYNYGDCIFTELPGVDEILGTSDDKNVIVDGGEANTAGESRVDDFLSAKGVTRIDYMFLSHPHSDHINGLQLVADLTKVCTFYANEDYSGIWGYNTLKSKLNADGASFYFVNPGDILSSPNQAQVNNGPCWDPHVFVKVVAAYQNGDNANDESVMFVLKFGSSSFVFGGDSEGNYSYNNTVNNNNWGEGYAMTNYPSDIDVDIFKAHHHGSNSNGSNSAAWLNAITPKITISQDGGSSFHPNIYTLGRIKAAGSIIYRNDLDGHILVKCDDAGNYDVVRETVRYDESPTDSKVSGAWLSNVSAIPGDLRFYQTYQSSVTLSWSAVARHLGCIVNYDVYIATCSNGDCGAGMGAAGGFTPSQKAEPYMTGIYQKVNSTDIAGKEAGENMYYTVTGLSPAATNYFFRLASIDTSYYYEHRYSNEVDGIPPGKIIILAGAPNLQTGGSITLTWTIPGGNGYSDNFNGYFYVQNTRSAADAANASFWNPLLAQEKSGEAKNLSPGANYSMTLYGLTPGTTYYLRVWSRDQSFNYSAMSDIITAYASPPVSVENVYVYPNPLKTGVAKQLTFKNLPKYAKINVFNVAGELVFETDKNDYTDEYKWDASNNSGGSVASGTYLYAVTDDSSRTKTGKFLIIR